MDIFQHFEERIAGILAALAGEGELPGDLDTGGVSCEMPRDSSHGDISTNAAMVLAKRAGAEPARIAGLIAARLERVEGVAAVEIAGPGFINLRLAPSLWQERVGDILAAGEDWGSSDMGRGQAVNVEYVSANPTGPLHAAHARGAIIGDSLAALLEKAGYTVTREYYINDAGTQVDTLARSTHHRYREALGEGTGPVPEGCYPGEYLKDVGKALAARDGGKWAGRPEEEWLAEFRAFAIAAMMDDIKRDLGRLGIRMDVFTSERALVEAGAVERAVGELEGKGHVYRGVLEPPKGKRPDDWEPREQTLFRSTAFGDDTDRPVRKSDGSWTYFATDIAYHLDKLSRGSAKLVNVWGADHGGYVKRMQAATAALSGEADALDVRLCQLVKLMDGGKPVKMSKRAGTFITLADVLDSVGKDILRFIMLTRRSDQTMDFDYAKVKEQSKDNPVFYVQYAHARAMSVLRQGGDASPGAGPDFSLLADGAELELIRMMASWPKLVEGAAAAREPHRVAFFLNDLAGCFHGLWNKGRDRPELRFIVEGEPALTGARLAMVGAAALVIRSGLAMLGVEAAEEM